MTLAIVRPPIADVCDKLAEYLHGTTCDPELIAYTCNIVSHWMQERDDAGTNLMTLLSNHELADCVPVAFYNQLTRRHNHHLDYWERIGKHLEEWVDAPVMRTILQEAFQSATNVDVITYPEAFRIVTDELRHAMEDTDDWNYGFNNSSIGRLLKHNYPLLYQYQRFLSGGIELNLRIVVPSNTDLSGEARRKLETMLADMAKQVGQYAAIHGASGTEGSTFFVVSDLGDENHQVTCYFNVDKYGSVT